MAGRTMRRIQNGEVPVDGDGAAAYARHRERLLALSAS